MTGLGDPQRVVVPVVTPRAHRVVVAGSDREPLAAIVTPKELGRRVGSERPVARRVATDDAAVARCLASVTRQSRVVEAVVARLSLRSSLRGDRVLHRLGPRRFRRSARREAVSAIRWMRSREEALVPRSLNARPDVGATLSREYNRRRRTEWVPVRAPSLPVPVAEPSSDRPSLATRNGARRHASILGEVQFGGES